MARQTYSSKRILVAAIVFFAVLIAVLLVGSGSPFGISFDEDNTNTTQPVKAKAATYQDSYIYARDFIGQVEAQQTSQAGFEIGGMLKRMPYDEGDVVKAGDVLAELDIQRLNARRNEADAGLTRAKADAKLAASTYKRFAEARKANAVSAQEKDEARETRDTTAASVSIAKAQLESIAVDIEKSKLISPFDGVVIKRMTDVGTVVGAGQAVLEIQQNSPYDVRIGVTSKMANELNVGQKKSVIVDGSSHEATIRSILPVRGQARTVNVILELDHNNRLIRPGDVVRLPLEYSVDQRGFWVPLTALKEGKRGLWSLYVANNDHSDSDELTQTSLSAERRAVEVHYTGSERAYVSGAMKEGEMIVVKGTSKLVPGQQIRVVGADDEQ